MSQDGLGGGPSVAALKGPAAGSRRPAGGKPEPVDIWRRIGAMSPWLLRARSACAAAPPEVAKAAEWLLDNDYHVHRAIGQVERDLPPEFYFRLPAAERADRPPRVFSLAHAFLHASRLQVSLAGAVDFFAAFQVREPLTIAELWAVPTMLRLACLEILACALATLFKDIPPPFRPSASLTADTAGFDDSERVARAIANLGQIASVRWEDFFERVSIVERVLREDPAGFYGRMDFATRDSYRRTVEEVATGLDIPESEVARRCIDASSAASGVARHVGHHLVGSGREALEQELGYRPPAAQRLRRWLAAHATGAYLGGVALLTLAALVVPSLYLWSAGAGVLGWIVGTAATLIPASILAMALIHWAVTTWLPPRVLPKLDFSDGIAADCATLVIVPVLVASPSEAAALVDQMELHRLANPDPSLRFALLSDLVDAAHEHVEGDDAIEEALVRGIESLNRRYGEAGRSPFHLLHRRRRYNPAEARWMGWERKRGKIEQLNRLIVGEEESGFPVSVGDGAALRAIRYVVTVDADTRLPRGTVNQLVGALAHPLNRAVLDERSGRVASGYTLIQPRVEISPESGNRSSFARLFTGDTAIDIYSRAVSDVYQDLFGEGIFVGKGVYEVETFHRTVDGRVPENAILSHDLFEGILGRAALATDIVLYEKFPATYDEYLRRWHRWVRGDWQLLPWLFPSVPARHGRRRNRLSAIDRWKVFDNLRRSLVAPGLLVFGLSGWLLLPRGLWLWTMLMALAPAGHIFTDLVTGLARGRRRGALHGILAQAGDQTGRLFLALAFMPVEAATAAHAATVALWRMNVSHRNLLEWTPAAHLAARPAGTGGRSAAWRRLWTGPAVAGSAGLLLFLFNAPGLEAAAPLLLLWALSPEVALRIARARRLEPRRLRPKEQIFVRGVARRTWLYFETFAGPEDNWLPPDNYQEQPYEEIAHRTSPTNLGMMLASAATAWDLGYLGASELAARLDSVFATLARLERHRGHFLNWYDTRSLTPLEPRYVSTVDSGNLAICLIATAAACEEAAASPRADHRQWQGLLDTVALLAEACAELGPAAAGLCAELDAAARREDGAMIDELAGTVCRRIEAELISASETGAALEPLAEASVWLERVRHQLGALQRDLGPDSAGLAAALDDLAARARSLAFEMDFRPLFDEERLLFHIGYNLSADRSDPHHYDLLASEARLASYFAIAKGDVPARHWFFLGRPLTRAGPGITLMSWNGSMFEYLMAPLFLRSGPETLLAESDRTAARMQRRYGERMDMPWGISESAFADRDPHHRYRYQAFGVPGLGLKRGLESDLVVAPYASALALAIEPGEAAANLRRLWRMGAGGRYGLLEAVDFTPERLPPRRSFVLVRAYMAHHQGMILCAIGNALTGGRLIDRVGSERRLRATELLLSERVPRELPSEIDREVRGEAPAREGPKVQPPHAWTPAPADACPQLHLLGNGRMASWISEAGAGALRWRHHALTRFAADPTVDGDGLWIYVQDLESGHLWSAGRQPTQAVPSDYRVTFHPHMAEFQRRDQGIAMRTEVAVAHGDDIEMRRVRLVNETARRRILAVTSCGEVVLAPPVDDERHPAFSKLFVNCEHRLELDGLLFWRHARRSGESSPALLHRVVADDKGMSVTGVEADRAAFLGRGGAYRSPRALAEGLSGTVGRTLDPVMALQVQVELAPHETRELCFVTCAGGSREAVLDIAARYASLASIEWALDDAASAAARNVQALQVMPDSLPALQQLASFLVYSGRALRPAAPAGPTREGGQPDLWSLGISGDDPILLVHLDAGDGADAGLLRELVAGHRLWIQRGLAVDLVLLKSSASGYLEPERERLSEILREHGAHEYLGHRGGIHIVSFDQAAPAAAAALEGAARVLLREGRGKVAAQLASIAPLPPEIPRFEASRAAEPPDPVAAGPEGLIFESPLGGFTADGGEFVIHLEPGAATPAPWCNILANEAFGTIVSESGGGFSWAVNSGENRLTPWSNDPVADSPGEMLFLRDEETAVVWTPSPYAAAQAACRVRHGAGYSIWEQSAHGLDQEMLVFVPLHDPVKIVRLRLHNLRDRPRRVTATYYAEWLLGSLPSLFRPAVRVEYDPRCEAILAASAWNPDFAGRVAFLAASRSPHGVTADRREFLGREGDLRRPAALGRWGLSSRVEAHGDPCGAYQVHLELAAGETGEVVFLIGQGADRAEAETLIGRWRDPGRVEEGLAAVRAHWDALLGAVAVHTPDPAFDLLVNRWLPYQTVTSRLLARAGFYQAGGAIGFRDQLQDVLALLHADPARARAQILTCCAHQFEEGDVLHWWHPPFSRGVRTRCSDDLLWLPHAVAAYVAATGDRRLLDETTPFLSAPPLGPREEDRYTRYEAGQRSGTVFEHCAAALDKGLTRGAHGLPLIGTGDWNDGMDRLGREGRGESVWLAWFSIVTAEAFAPLAKGRDEAAGARWTAVAAGLRRAAEQHGWDGHWYRRAFDDEGVPLGTATDAECRIDSISQSWAALAGADAGRVGEALDSAWRELVDEPDRLVRLLVPPFGRTPRDPGYIRAYPPGVRENGGQYTHAGAWLGLAFRARGDGERAYRLFDLLNPVRRTADGRYRIEPYVAAGDIAAAPPLTGRGGWSWYTGSAAWLWRLGVEGILGIRPVAGEVAVDPCLPPGWPGYTASVRRGDRTWRIEVRRAAGSSGTEYSVTTSQE